MNALVTQMDTNFLALLPAGIALVTALLATVLGFHLSRRLIGGIGILGLLGSVIAAVALWNRGLSSFDGAWRADNFALAFTIVLAVGAILVLLVSMDTPKRNNLDVPEFYSLLLYAVTGTMILVHARHLIVVLIGFEVMSLAVYVLSAFQDRAKSEEAGMKYFLLGSLSSAILIYGIALIYGATGSFDLETIRAGIIGSFAANLPLLTVGAIFILIGFSFKVAFAPFHQWVPDVYTGAPTLVVGYMSVGIKAAAFAGLLYLFGLTLPGLAQEPLRILIALTLLVGNISALRQTNLKRMLAYSSVSQAGYIGLTLLGNPNTAWSAAIYYLFAYTLMNVGAFAVLGLISRTEDGPEIASLAGLSRRHPFLAAALAFFLASLAGIPPLAGFFSKYLVFQAAALSNNYGLLVLGVITSGIGLYYYLRPIVLAYFYAPQTELPTQRAGFGTRVAVSLAVVGVLVLGVLPNLALQHLGAITEVAHTAR